MNFITTGNYPNFLKIKKAVYKNSSSWIIHQIKIVIKDNKLVY